MIYDDMRANLKLVKVEAKQTGTHVRITWITHIMNFMAIADYLPLLINH